jgi:hypothetical protein
LHYCLQCNIDTGCPSHVESPARTPLNIDYTYITIYSFVTSLMAHRGHNCFDAGPASHRTLSSMADASFLRQMRRGMLSLVRAIATEALGLGATVAGGAQLVLQQRRHSPPASPLQM